MIDWRIYYDDGTNFDSSMGTIEDAPALGVILIWQRNNDDEHHPTERVVGLDWYWWRPDLNRWLGGDIHGYLDQAMHLRAIGLKMGRNMRNKHYFDLLETVNRDPDFWAGTE